MRLAEQPEQDWPQSPAERPGAPPPGTSVTALAAVVAAVAALGLPLGLLWAILAPDVPVLVTAGGPSFADPQPEQVAAADGWFVLLAVPTGFLAAAGAWRLARRTRGPAGLVAVTLGAVASGLLAWWLGRLVGLSGYEAALETAANGTLLERPADLRVVRAGWWPPLLTGVPLVPALVAAVTYTLLAAWSRYPSLLPRRDAPDD